MAVSFVGTLVDSAVSGADADANPTSGSPGAAVAGDLILIVSSTFARAGNEGRIGNALTYNPIVDVSNGQRVRVAWKNFVVGEEPVIIEGSGNAADAITETMLIFRGHDPTSPIDVTTVTAQGSGSAPDAGAIVPASDDCMIVVMAGSSVNDATHGTISDYTVIGGVARSDTNAASSGCAYRLLSGGAGASENPAAFSAWGAGSWVAATIAIRPPVVAGQPYAKRMGGVQFVQDFRRGPNTNLWRKVHQVLLPPSLIRV